MNKEIQTYNYTVGLVLYDIRTVLIDGEPWFVAKDVAELLGYKDTINAIKMHCRGVAKHHPIVDRIGRTQQARIINEPDLYRLIAHSQMPAAVKFEQWIYEEVLPTIRKTGGAYLTPAKAEELLANPDLIIGLAQQVKDLKEERERLSVLNNVLTDERDYARDERDEAIRTKACISDKKTATAMGKLGGAMNANRILKEKLGIAENYKQVRAIEWLGMYSTSSGGLKRYTVLLCGCVFTIPLCVY